MNIAIVLVMFLNDA